MTLAAGILFLTPDKKALFLKRGNGGDHPGEWCFPGGHLEPGETLEQCAEREAIEECGVIPKGARTLWTRQVSSPVVASTGDAAPALAHAPMPQGAGAVDFTTFVQQVKETFEPTLCDEHTGYAWASVDTPPEPLHPGSRIALARLTMDELGIARAMSAGQLTSPQRYENVCLWAIRITGTGAAYRRKLDEYVWRDPALYLNDEFLARCNGLSVVFLHPEKATLDTQSFAEQVVGSTLLPFIGDGLHFPSDEVWAIVKVYDEAANKIMDKEDMSTSPCVVFRDPTVNNSLELENGSQLLIEGKPSLLDHIAICERGVWDKGGEPAGVRRDSVQPRSNDMTPEEKAKADADQARKDADEKEKDEKEKADAEAKAKADAEAKAKADADAGQKLDKVLLHIDSLGKRMDSFEENFKKDSKKKKDGDMSAEEVAADKAKKDAEKKAEKEAKEKADAEAEEKKEKEKSDTQAKKDSDISTIRAEVEALSKKVDRAPRTDAEHRLFADHQAAADSVFQEFGKFAPRPMDGETLVGYRRRIADQLKTYSNDWKGVDLAAVSDSSGFDVIERRIFADAREAARRPSDLKEGELRAVTRVDSTTGRRETQFFASKGTFIGALKRQSPRVTRLGLKNKEA